MIPAAADRVDAIFTALADPTRRHVIATLAAQESATPTSLAAELPMTRQAVAKHLLTLGEAGLVRSERVGRETRYALTPEGLTDAAAWMAEVGAQWDRRLARLAALLSPDRPIPAASDRRMRSPGAVGRNPKGSP